MNARRGTPRRLAWTAAIVAVAVVAGACSSSSGAAKSSSTTGASGGSTGVLASTATSSDGKVTVRAVSAPAPYVSGTAVLVDVTWPGSLGAAASSKAPTVMLNGTTASVDLAREPHIGDDPQGHASESVLIHGLHEGANTVAATYGGSTATLHVTDHPIQGPVFSGPRQAPFACTTEGAGLGPSSPPDCAAPTKVSWDYVTTSGAVKAVPAGGPPADIGTGADGKPVYVYDEKGVIDRSIYEVAVPTSAIGTTSYQPSHSAWNQRLVYRFGGGCGTTYSQGSDFAGVTDPRLLSAGYAVVTSTLNTFQSACNAVLSAEVTMMVKQHVIELIGDPAFTIGDGGSGGSIQQLQIAQDYPGLVDGLSPELPFPDAISIAGGVSDCTLLDTYYQGAGKSLTSAERAAINGHATDQTCGLWQASFGQEIKADSCGGTVPKNEVFDAATNPKGVRCTLQDGNINILGTDPATGFAYRPVTNLGVQYGFEALRSHAISVDQFLALNAAVGGFDPNGQVVPARTKAPDKAFEIAYENGAVDEGGALWNVPIILTNPYDDPLGDIHDRFRSFSIRARLTKPDGTADPNLLIWTVPGPTNQGALDAQLVGALSNTAPQIELLDQWLTKADTSPTNPDAPAMLAAARPADAVDTCTLPDGQVLRGSGVYTGSNACTKAYPLHGDPRTASGAPLRNDILACQLAAVSASTEPVPFTDAQLDQLRKIFPDGVCDWSKPGIGQDVTIAPWQDFGS
jgi:hypothetical protein